MTETRLLIVDDEKPILKQLEWALKEEYGISTAQTVEEATDGITSFKPDIIILDLSLSPGPDRFEGFEVLRYALEENPRIKVIVVTGHDHRENALKAIEEGAHDFYTKPVDIEELKIILNRAAHILSLEKELNTLREIRSGQTDFAGMIGISKPMVKVFDKVRKVAPMDVTVLVTGESGTGKELVARAIHAKSPRSSRPFVPINCGAIPENLLESELFGHEKGSFTGAHATRTGKFEAAQGGTLFLDEIGELPQTLQVKLLRFLQDQVIERVGGNEQIQLNVRVIAATNRELEEMISASDFREDLYYRINTIRINLPPLRDREDDILLLSKFFLNNYNRQFRKNIRGFSDSARELLYSHLWPGNVRELENRIMRAVIMSSGKSIEAADFDLESESAEAAGAGKTGLYDIASARRKVTLKEARGEVESKLITGALIRTEGNVSAAAQQLGISRPTLHDMIKKYRIDPEQFRANGKN